MEHEPGKQEQSPYNLRTNFEATKEAMAYVEQGGWLRGENRVAEHWDEASDGERFTSVEGARRWLKNIDPNEDAKYNVYGDGGMNRWYIRADGSVLFSRSHATESGLRRAQEKGFPTIEN